MILLTWPKPSAVLWSAISHPGHGRRGLGAPLVPYTEFLLYRSETETVALQNIGGIGNVTLLPAGCRLEDVVAFDTGPGNMVRDALASRITGGRLTYDEGEN